MYSGLDYHCYKTFKNDNLKFNVVILYRNNIGGKQLFGDRPATSSERHSKPELGHQNESLGREVGAKA